MDDPSDNDPKKLRRLIEEMAITITRLSDDLYMKCVVGSVFDTRSVENTTEDLKALNEGNRPKWLFTVNPDASALSVVYRSADEKQSDDKDA